jgi:hypothetical protein
MIKLSLQLPFINYHIHHLPLPALLHNPNLLLCISHACGWSYISVSRLAKKDVVGNSPQ